MENLDKINGVQRMQEYIEASLDKPITLYMLAQAAGYSPWYSTKIFKELIGKTPFEYIRALRLTKAATRIRDEQSKIIDVAFDFVFDSHEGFTRAFSKHFGVTPNYYSKNTPPVKYFVPYNIRDYYLIKNRGVKKMEEKTNSNTVFVQVIYKPERKLILKRGIKATNYYEYAEEVGCDIWGILSSIKEAINEPIGMWLPENLQVNGTSIYSQGVEVPIDYEGKVPEGFDIIKLPACKMMVFQGQPYEDEYFDQAIEDLWEVMNNYDPKLYGFNWAENDGPRFQLAPMGYRGYIEGRPVREIK